MEEVDYVFLNNHDYHNNYDSLQVSKFNGSTFIESSKMVSLYGRRLLFTENNSWEVENKESSGKSSLVEKLESFEDIPFESEVVIILRNISSNKNLGRKIETIILQGYGPIERSANAA